MSAAISTGKKPLRIFFSAGEPSGDLHGANLIRALRGTRPDILCEGFGGERMQSAGFEELFPLSQLAVMGLFRVLANIGTFARLLRQATDHLRQHRPGAVVLIDFPGFNWWLAKRAKALGIPVFYFVPPQLWAWAGWRVRKMRKYADHVLCTLPFEKQWYQERGIDAPYIGHPYFDALERQTLTHDFVAGQQSKPGTVIGILPGSRGQEIENNFLTQLRAASHIQQRRPDCRFLVAGLKREHADHFARVLCEQYPAPHRHAEGTLETGLRGAWSLPAELCVGRTPEIIHLAHSCISVSGSVSLELLYARKPSVILYRASFTMYLVYLLLCDVKHVSLVNLLAGQALYPEFVTCRCKAEAIGNCVLRWLEEPETYARLKQDLSALCEEVAQPGACGRAAEYILSAIREARQPLAA